jgi:plasmid stability protein
MPVNLSVKNVPDALAAKLRLRAEKNHRSLQGELLSILESAATEGTVDRARSSHARYEAGSSGKGDGLVDRLMAIAGARGIDTSKRLSREQAHDRPALRKCRA